MVSPSRVLFQKSRNYSLLMSMSIFPFGRTTAQPAAQAKRTALRMSHLQISHCYIFHYFDYFRRIVSTVDGTDSGPNPTNLLTTSFLTRTNTYNRRGDR